MGVPEKCGTIEDNGLWPLKTNLYSIESRSQKNGKLPVCPRFPGAGFTAHIAYGFGESSTVHVDSPGAADLVPTLLHETFHDTLYAVGDPRLAVAATGDNSYLTASQKAASRAASREFDKHCTPK